MNIRNVSSNFKKAVFAQETKEAFICLLTISDPSFVDDIRVCDDPFEVLPTAGVRGVVSRGEEYVYIPFNIELPSQNDSGVARSKLVVDNVSREIVAAVRRATKALSVKIEIVLSSDVDTPEVSFDRFKLERVTYDALQVSGELSMEYYDLEPFPAKRFTASDFPGIF